MNSSPRRHSFRKPPDTDCPDDCDGNLPISWIARKGCDVNRNRRHDGDESDDSPLGVPGQGLARRIVIEDLGSDETVCQRPAEESLIREAEEIGCWNHPRYRWPAGYEDSDEGAAYEE